MAPKAVSLFTGIGGMDLGLERAGFEVVRQVEIDPFCLKVLEKHWPLADRGTDIREEEPETYAERYGTVDLICGGFPCQDLSVAGKRAGLAGERSGLFYELLRIADSNPSAWVLAENVPGLLSSSEGRDFATVLGELSGFLPEVPEDGWRNSGVCYGSKGCVAWRVLDAQYFGVAQRRRRVFIVRSPSRAGAFQVLFEPDCLPGNPPPSRETKQGLARVLTKGSRMDGETETFITQALTGTFANGGADDNKAQAGFLVAAPLTAKPWADNESQERKLVVVTDVCGTLMGGSGKRGWSVSAENAADGQLVIDATRVGDVRVTGDGLSPTLKERMGTGGGNVPLVAATLRSGGAGGVPSSRGENIVCAYETGQGWWNEDKVAGTLRAEGENRPSRPSNIVAAFLPNAGAKARSDAYAIEQSPTLMGEHIPAVVCGFQGQDLAHAVRSNPSKADKPSSSTYVCTLGHTQSNGLGIYEQDVANTLEAVGSANQAVVHCIKGAAIGREPENGPQYGEILSDGTTYTLNTVEQHAVSAPMGVRRLTPTECERLQAFPDGWTLYPDGKTPDSPRYRALGNAVCVNVAEWIGKRIKAVMDKEASPC